MYQQEDIIIRYSDRLEAGHVLSERLQKYRNANGVVLAIPRGGVPVASIVAKELNMPLDLALSKKIGHPFHKEYAIGAVSMVGSFVLPHEGVSDSYIKSETRKIQGKLKKMYEALMGNKEPLELKDKIVIIVDDGIATGNTASATVSMVKTHLPQKIVVAVPVAPQPSIDRLSKEADEIICPLLPGIFIGVGRFYEDFGQVSNEEVKSFLEEYRKEAGQPNTE